MNRVFIFVNCALLSFASEKLCASERLQTSRSASASAAATAVAQEVRPNAAPMDHVTAHEIAEKRNYILRLVGDLPVVGSSDKDVWHGMVRDTISGEIAEIIQLEFNETFIRETERLNQFIAESRNNAPPLLKNIFVYEDEIKNLDVQQRELIRGGLFWDLKKAFDQQIVAEYRRLEGVCPTLNTYSPFKDLGRPYFQSRGGLAFSGYEQSPTLPQSLSSDARRQILIEHERLTAEFKAFIENKKREQDGVLKRFFSLQSQIEQYQEMVNRLNVSEDVRNLRRGYVKIIADECLRIEQIYSDINTYQPYKILRGRFISYEPVHSFCQRWGNDPETRAFQQRRAELENEFGIVREEGNYPGRSQSGIDPNAHSWRYARRS